jgi:RecB family exonuclease
MLDGLFGDLLAEGVNVEALRQSLSGLRGDDFTHRRNEWVADTYAGFLRALEEEGLYDARQIHSLAAERIETGGLAAAVGSAKHLHIYGITSLRQRQRLFRALSDQTEVLATVYLLREPETSEWDCLTDDLVDVEDPGASTPSVQPVPDAVREANHVARQVKRLLVETGCDPREVAIVARSGRDDTHRAYRALTECGVPATARLRTKLSEVPALRAILDLLRAQAGQWNYRGVRSVTMTPYFGDPLDPAALDFLAARRRIQGLTEWIKAVDGLLIASREGGGGRAGRQMKSQGLTESRIQATLDRLKSLQASTEAMSGELTESGWIELTRRLTAGDLFQFRRRLCRVVGDRYDVVRMDQRAVTIVDALLGEWAGLVRGSTQFRAAEWYDRLRRLLEANELALSTPMQEGVQILEAHEAALTPFEHTFVVHANDGEFPRTAGGGGIFSERERSVLRQSGIPVEDRSLSLRRERSLWRAVTSGPSVTVTYRTATVGGVPLLPSLMVPGHEPASALPTTTGSFDATEAYSPNEQRRLDVGRVARSCRGGEVEPVPVADMHSVRHAVVGAFAEELRTGGLDDVPGIADLVGVGTGALIGRDWPVSERAHLYAGWLRDPVVRAALDERFGPDHVWSASQLQSYSVRPFDFLLQRVLRIEDQSEAEEDTTPLATGSVIHAILESLYRKLLSGGDEEIVQATEWVDSVSAEVFATIEREATIWLGLPAIWNLKRDHIREMIRGFVVWDEKYRGKKKSWPVAIEHVFGADGVEPVLLSGFDVHGEAAGFLASGRIDRVDMGQDGLVRIIDYKSKSVPSKKGREDGALLQSALYMQAWESMSSDPVTEGVFLSVGKPGAGSSSGLKAAELESVMSFAFSIPARVRAGLFEPVQALSSRDVKPWQPGREITRSDRVIGAGNRFEQPYLEDDSNE